MHQFIAQGWWNGVHDFCYGFCVHTRDLSHLLPQFSLGAVPPGTTSREAVVVLHAVRSGTPVAMLTTPALLGSTPLQLALEDINNPLAPPETSCLLVHVTITAVGCIRKGNAFDHIAVLEFPRLRIFHQPRLGLEVINDIQHPLHHLVALLSMVFQIRFIPL